MNDAFILFPYIKKWITLLIIKCQTEKDIFYHIMSDTKDIPIWAPNHSIIVWSNESSDWNTPNW